MSRVFRLDRRAVGKISLLTAVFYFSAYFYRFFTLGYAHDSLLINQSIDMTWQIQLGRFLQPVYLLFRGDIAVPYLIGLLAYLYLAAAICLVVDLLSLSSTLSISLVCMALCANTTLTRLHGTFHMMADSYMLALLLSVLCVFVAVRLRHGVWLAPVLLCGSAALYQSYVPVATVFFLILLVHHALDGFSFRALLLRGVRYLGVLIAGLVFYSLCLRVVYALTGQTAADSYNGMAGMCNFEGYSIVDLLRRAYLFPFEKMARPQTAFPRAAAAAYGFLLLFSLAAVCYLLHARRIALPCAALTFVFLLLVPFGADFIYLPEVDFSMTQFIEDVKRVYAEKGSCIVAVSEGIHYEDGGFVSEAKVAANDGFGHAQLGGLAAMLAQVLKEETGTKVRGIELNLLQRCGAHLASETDIEESYMAGKAAVENAINGINGRMIGFERGIRDGKYACKTKLIPLMEVANTEKKVPREWINEAGNGVNHQFVEYALPLIQGEPDLPKVDSLPRFAHLKKILAK